MAFDQLTTLPISGTTDLGGFLSSLFTGAIGAGQVFGGGGGSVSGSAAAGAAAANPFGAQYAGYQPQLQQAITGQTGQIGAVGSNIQPIISQLTGLGGTAAGQAMGASPGSLTSQLNALATNYMDNPAIQAQYRQGLSAVNAGAAATGILGSGKQLVELEQYGQDYAAKSYQQQFQDILAGNQQSFKQNATIQQLLAGALGTAGGLTNQAGQIGIAGQGNLIQQLLAASGATTGSPQMAGGILSGQFQNSQQAQANLASGLSGALSRLLGGGGGGIPNIPGVSNLISDLLGSGSFTNAGGIAAIGSLLDSGASGAGVIGDLGGYGGGLFSGIGGSGGDVSSLIGAIDAGQGTSLGADLGSIFSGFSSGTTGAAAAGGAASSAAGGAAEAAGGAGSLASGAGMAVGGLFAGVGAAILGSLLTPSISQYDEYRNELQNPAQAITAQLGGGTQTQAQALLSRFFGGPGGGSMQQDYQNALNYINSDFYVSSGNDPNTRSFATQMLNDYMNNPSLWGSIQAPVSAAISGGFGGGG